MTSHDVEAYLRGLLPGVAFSEGSRLPAAVRAKIPADTGEAARVPAGVHLALTGSALAIDLPVQIHGALPLAAPTMPAAFFVGTAGKAEAAVPMPSQSAVVRIPLPARGADETVHIYMPEGFHLGLTSFEAVDGYIAPAPRGPRWVVYGDSISQGWSVSAPGRAWPSVVADELGLDLVNLGFAGSARGELPAADAVATSAADGVAIAWGTNAWSTMPTDVGQIAETMRLFLTVVRQGLPKAPVVVMSPIVRPAADDTPNRFGATLTDLRVALERAVGEYVRRTGDDQIILVPGADLVLLEQLVDGVHPGDAGHASIGAHLAPLVARSMVNSLA